MLEYLFIIDQLLKSTFYQPKRPLQEIVLNCVEEKYLLSVKSFFAICVAGDTNSEELCQSGEGCEGLPSLLNICEASDSKCTWVWVFPGLTGPPMAPFLQETSSLEVCAHLR